ncbi:hypothetical protein AVDCRST_MAG81-3331 [uncultured Synechococcales cyanobacterium]|uniref:Uncharacterized protein n=1 Tax=uncultured Synechococcales cyanobacterium TaxID=1936017 RepID=A0A6J4VN45_9CYAN|nr:hypothetical protein AVDCRST_MAG81-3331 [uncultured Synechococcales cyanobacterium]
MRGWAIWTLEYSSTNEGIDGHSRFLPLLQGYLIGNVTNEQNS